MCYRLTSVQIAIFLIFLLRKFHVKKLFEESFVHPNPFNVWNTMHEKTLQIHVESPVRFDRNCIYSVTACLINFFI